MQSEFPRPWLAFSDGVPGEVDLPELSLVGAIEQTAAQYPKRYAIEYMGTRFNFEKFMAMVNQCAQAFLHMGVVPGDSVLISMPNIPNALIAVYAANKIGARACMTHPLSTKVELQHYATSTGSRVALTIDLFFDRFEGMLNDGILSKLIVAKISDYLPSTKKALFSITKGRKIKKVPARPDVIFWTDFFKAAEGQSRPFPVVSPDAGSVVLFSGGTTQLPKGIELSGRNFNALAYGTRGIVNPKPEDSILTILPIFHGFGLGLCVHTCLSAAVMVILVPEFSTKNYIDCLIKHKPSYIAGVPTLFEALMRDKRFKKARFHRLKAAYSGGDSLYPGIKRRFDAMIKAQGSRVELKEGYGLTETVTACMISPDRYKEGSMGIPLPNMLAKVVAPGTMETVAYGEEGEICVTGPQVMLGYVGDEEATSSALKAHEDGRIWLHTGDIGTMDEEGYFYFKSRMKRILKVSGMSVYPVQVEQVLETHPAVFKACVIGVPDDYQMTCVKAFVIVDQEQAGDKDPAEIKKELLAHCRKHLIKWSVPRDIEFRKELPSTLVGKVSYTALEQEEIQKQREARGAAEGTVAVTQ